MDRTERGTVGLVVGYAATLSLVAVVDESALWLAWAVTMTVLAGAALVRFNRSKTRKSDRPGE
ncbi:hypothetical protein [Halopiger djelfimassiliensis]|uniref:hypothetical protein n=1 Tax=Halopiger djelfimassiliensis TaxID=1293047 RepID=UPI0006782866|nr:hypothetical protein [Halopiger djelfimassiliensis]